MQDRILWRRYNLKVCDICNVFYNIPLLTCCNDVVITDSA